MTNKKIPAILNVLKLCQIFQNERAVAVSVVKKAKSDRHYQLFLQLLLFSRLHAAVPYQHTNAVPCSGVPRANGEDSFGPRRLLPAPRDAGERRHAASARLAVLRQVAGIRVAVPVGPAGGPEEGAE